MCPPHQTIGHLNILINEYPLSVLVVRELMGETLPPPPLGNFGDLYFQKPYTLRCSDQVVCTYIAGTFVLEGQLKVGTSLILGVGVTF